jgi:hypothetical protein
MLSASSGVDAEGPRGKEGDWGPFMRRELLADFGFASSGWTVLKTLVGASLVWVRITPPLPSHRQYSSRSGGGKTGVFIRLVHWPMLASFGFLDARLIERSDVSIDVEFRFTVECHAWNSML